MCKLKIFMIFFVMVLILSGCTQEENKMDTNESAEKMRTYESSKGNIDIPVNPERIYTDYYVGEVLALEQNLVGADLTYNSPAWSDKLEGVVDTGQSMEKVASLNPDLILTINEDLYEQYSSIAPTIYLEYGAQNPIDTFKLVAQILNQEDKAQKIIDEFNDEVEKTKKLIDKPELTYSILELWDNQMYVYGNNYGRAGYIIYDMLGLSGTETAENSIIDVKESYKLISLESLKDYAGDVIILSDSGDNPYYEEMQKSPLWKELPAVKNDQVYTVDSKLFYFVDILSLQKQLEDLNEIFKGEL